LIGVGIGTIAPRDFFMMPVSFRKVFFASLTLALAMLHTSLASAQIVLGNGTIIIGAPNSTATSTGWGNYAGTGGFVPGYGYYPVFSNDPVYHTPLRDWLHRKIAEKSHNSPPVNHIGAAPPVPGAAAPRHETPAVLQVHVPAEAEVWFDNARTATRGENRRFVSPPLEQGKRYSYEVRVRWLDNGKPIELNRTLVVVAGEQQNVDFLAETSGQARQGK
jgi:uncharacterized protein (TIGR03000 family)